MAELPDQRRQALRLIMARVRCRHGATAGLLLIGLLLAATVGGCAQPSIDTVQHASARIIPRPYHLHLNGIGGLRGVDYAMLRGLEDGGLDADVQTYDWCASDPGLGALLRQNQHVTQAKKVAQIIEGAWRAQPGRRITLSAHSAGAGIIIWALQDLPPEVKVDSLVLLAPALSPTYDLSAALRHIKGHIYVFYSQYDEAVLGLGTSLFGTVDGVKTDAAGKVGFSPPPDADPAQYEKLVQIPYESSWIRLGNIGGHIGAMSRPFARDIIAPLLLEGKMPQSPDEGAMHQLASAATRPAAQSLASDPQILPPTTRPTQ